MALKTNLLPVMLVVCFVGEVAVVLAAIDIPSHKVVKTPVLDGMGRISEPLREKFQSSITFIVKKTGLKQYCFKPVDVAKISFPLIPYNPPGNPWPPQRSQKGRNVAC